MPTYPNTGTCSKSVAFELDDDGVVTSCRFQCGCLGNTAGVARLAIGRKASDLVSALKGIQCRNGTSCPDQFARALEAELARRGPVVAHAVGG